MTEGLAIALAILVFVVVTIAKGVRQIGRAHV